VVGMISDDWLIVSALVQAVVAVVIGAFTIALWRSTNRLAKATQEDAELTAQMARIQTILSARELALAAPRILAMVDIGLSPMTASFKRSRSRTAGKQSPTTSRSKRPGGRRLSPVRWSQAQGRLSRPS
jgi:hypothetical protein